MAGFFVVGVDKDPQPRYVGDAFVQMDAIEAMGTLNAGGYITDTTGHKWRLRDFVASSASPPCQAHTALNRVYIDDSAYSERHPDLIPATRRALIESDKPYVIENVPGALLINPITLCGSMFGLRVYRHRLFETSFFTLSIPHIPHKDKTPAAGRGISPKGFICVTGNGGLKGIGFTKYARQAMGIHWMNRYELSQAIPPAYTHWIGERLLEVL